MRSLAKGITALVALAVASSGVAADPDPVIASGSGTGSHWITVQFTAAGTVHLDLTARGHDSFGTGYAFYRADGTFLGGQLRPLQNPTVALRLRADKGGEPIVATVGVAPGLDSPSWGPHPTFENLPPGGYVVVLWVGGWPETWNYSVSAFSGASNVRVTNGTDGTFFLTNNNFTGPTIVTASVWDRGVEHMRGATIPLHVDHVLIGGGLAHESNAIGEASTRFVGGGVNQTCTCFFMSATGGNAIQSGDYAIVRDSTVWREGYDWVFTAVDFAWPER